MQRPNWGQQPHPVKKAGEHRRARPAPRHPWSGSKGDASEDPSSSNATWTSLEPIKHQAEASEATAARSSQPRTSAHREQPGPKHGRVRQLQQDSDDPTRATPQLRKGRGTGLKPTANAPRARTSLKLKRQGEAARARSTASNQPRRPRQQGPPDQPSGRRQCGHAASPTAEAGPAGVARRPQQGPARDNAQAAATP